MDWLQALCLGIVQGLTEFLPVSSSAHLILVPVLTGWPDQGLAFDVAVHVGTLVAVLAYFRTTLVTLAADTLGSLHQRRLQGEGRLGAMILLATLPVITVGLLLDEATETLLRGPLVIAGANLVFAVPLWLAWRFGRGRAQEHAIGAGAALLIGLAQCLAVIPGTSRSGVTMTAGLALGLAPTAAARFSFLLSIPTIALAGGWKALGLITGDAPVHWGALAIGTLSSALAAYACIGAFLALLARVGMTPFVAYRLALGAVLLALFL
ncbi:undecaprenyl-diphosphate phosphatase [Arhodomonas sp. SL1]|uniref:undecaprenyl-diphosphate phosphatase n=1 Tax=Arhodomonas sp. SL1 TaxID=3425691 RepID=UPI003F882B5E